MRQCQAAQRPLQAVPWEHNVHSPLTSARPFLPCPDISGTSFRFSCTFELRTPFFSGRDRAGREKVSGDHRTDIPNNHLCRDWISGNPLAKAGAWKRLFRTCWPEEQEREKDRLFGPEDEDMTVERNSDKARKGELKFRHALFPLNSTDTALIAPRDPESGKVTHGPITYEVVNKESRCELLIDYLPKAITPEKAEHILKNLFLAARAIGKHEATIGGKSGIWGRIHLAACSVRTGPDLPRTITTCIPSLEPSR
ncbi:MAG: hypothetical protein Q3M24_13380 [Candidatus Electrothrix aestuarii]|uniref:Uncharacterized protein n=1 Tax=Candidatus Electrothrix aestuarii TaxID=3062594 RepID=A0AAU8LQW6_9BACT|nr:hypothetical protein [Candidatus Electrothrix aestuarii]